MTSYLAVLVFGGALVGLAVVGGGVQEAFTWLLGGFVWSYLVVVGLNAWGLTSVLEDSVESYVSRCKEARWSLTWL